VDPVPPTIDDRQRTYVVSGSASGIGRATVDYLEAAGGRVIGVDLHDADVCADLSTATGRTQAVEDVRGLVRDGVIDGVVSCAGASAAASSRLILAVNFFGATALLDGLRNSMNPAGNAGAVAVASASTHHPVDHRLVRQCLQAGEDAVLGGTAVSGAEAYVASKVALVRWVRANAPSEAWAGRGLSLNAVSPALVQTPMMEQGMASEENRERLLARYPMVLHGIAEPGAVASLIGYLVGGENSHVTGQNIYVDGGSEAVVRGDVRW
jgi:NAD(P)-dependent dehydrogenase (short-subunit alcohol dehydrogenase family)